MFKVLKRLRKNIFSFKSLKVASTEVGKETERDTILRLELVSVSQVLEMARESLENVSRYDPFPPDISNSHHVKVFNKYFSSSNYFKKLLKIKQKS